MTFSGGDYYLTPLRWPAETEDQCQARRRSLREIDRLLLAVEEFNDDVCRQYGGYPRQVHEPVPRILRDICHAAGVRPEIIGGSEMHRALLDLQAPFVRLSSNPDELDRDFRMTRRRRLSDPARLVQQIAAMQRLREEG